MLQRFGELKLYFSPSARGYKKKKKTKLQRCVITTTHSTSILQWHLLFACVHSSIDRLLIFGAAVVHNERRYLTSFFSEVGLSVGK